jgi:LysM repeat protein
MHSIWAQEPTAKVTESLFLQVGQLSERIQVLERELIFRQLELSVYQMPDRMTFCGEEIDLTQVEIKQRIEREWLDTLGNRAQVYLWMQFVERYFPIIEQQASTQNTCDELKFISLISQKLPLSDQDPLQNIWGLTEDQARKMGLQVNAQMDERADIEQSSQVVLKQLKEMRLEFLSWTLTLASHFLGRDPLTDLINSQSVIKFWDLDMPYSAERLVLKTLVAKEIMTHLKRYHFVQNQSLRTQNQQVTLLVPQKRKFQRNLSKLALLLYIPLRTLKQLNPSLKDQFPNTPFKLVIPSDKLTQTLEVLGLDQSSVMQEFSTIKPSESTTQTQVETMPQVQVQVQPEAELKAEPTKPEAKPTKPEAEPEPKVADMGSMPIIDLDQQIKIVPDLAMTNAEPKAGVEVFTGSDVKHKRTPEPTIKAEQTEKAKVVEQRSYVVKNGDSFWKIARKFNVTPEQIKEWNQIKDNQIQPGQVLKIY